MKYIPGFFLCLFLFSYGCKKFYAPPYIASPGSYLVVDGTINAGPGQTTIKLSKTVNIAAATTANPVLHAIINIESDRGDTYPVIEVGQGKYMSAALSLDITKHYRLRVKTPDAREYLSDFVPVTLSPGVDSVTYALRPNGMEFFVNTHDPANNTRFYRWEYEETWVQHSGFYSEFKSNGDTVIERDLANDQIYQCWKSDTSSVIILGTSSGLSSDVINKAPITFVDSTSIKMDGKQSIIREQKQPQTNAYSILVKQYAMTREAYSYWTNLKKNTQDIGRLFDPQPGEILGNIHSLTDPNEPVLGYISAGNMTTGRLFIANGQIPTLWTLISPYSNCRLDSAFLDTLLRGQQVRTNEEDYTFNLNKGTQVNLLQIPVQAIFDPMKGFIMGHTGGTPFCVDCTLQGTNKQPDFWQLIHQ